VLDELGEPTAALLRDTELLINGAAGSLEGEQRALLGRVRADAERIDLLLGNLSTLHEMQVGILEPEPTPTHVTKLIKKAVGSVRSQLETRQLQTRLTLGAMPVVRIDSVIVQRILSNLLETLCTLAQQGTTIGIQAFIEQNEGALDSRAPHLHIALSGSTTVESDRATSVVAIENDVLQSLVQAHQGRVWSTGRPDRGVVFHLTIPLQQPSLLADDRPGTGDRRG
jgi:signal transduction histidine kinase